MATVEVRNRERGALLGDRVRVADGFWSRLKGLLGQPALEDGEGLWIVPSRGVHMYGMKHPLDVALLDDERRVVATYHELAPWDRTRVHPDARSALELAPGTLERTGTEEGDRLDVTEGEPLHHRS